MVIFTGLLFPMENEYPSVLILGVLLTLRYLIPLLQQQVKDTSLKGSFGVIRKEMEISPSLDQLIQVGIKWQLFSCHSLLHILQNTCNFYSGSEIYCFCFL